MDTSQQLRTKLRSIDHRGYPAYKDLRGSYGFGDYILNIEHVQGDPFAAPSRLSVRVPAKTAGFPEELLAGAHRRVAIEDLVLRCFGAQTVKFSHKAHGSGKSGLIGVSRPGQEIMARSACEMEEKSNALIIRFAVGFPANGRTINAGELEKVLFDFLPECVLRGCLFKNIGEKKVMDRICLADDVNCIRQELKKRSLVAFVADGALLARKSGASDLPMEGCIPFASPDSLRVEMELPHAGKVTGMGIPRGITLIVGGGYHGKSTLLKAIERGVYDHIRGDGREFVITDDKAMKIRAEDGRAITGVDVSMFINNLPGGRDTTFFSTENASGSTSQAANLVEAAQAGSDVLLIDEDTCATNFMVRDALMERVVAREKEPITPFMERAGYLYDVMGISTVLVAGSSGAYFHIAHNIIQMDEYVPVDITQKAKEAAKADPDSAPDVPEAPSGVSKPRIPKVNTAIRREERVKTKSFGTDTISIDRTEVDIRYLEQLVDQEQAAALSLMLLKLEKEIFDDKKSVSECVKTLTDIFEEKGFSGISPGSYIAQDLAYVRPAEIAAMINRYRALRL